MRWGDLFSDLESEFAEARRREEESQANEMARAELARVRIIDRVRAHEGKALSVELEGGVVVHGRLEHAGNGWAIVAGQHQDWLINTDAVLSYQGLGRAVAGAPRASWSGTGIGAPLRALMRNRELILVHRGGSLNPGKDSGAVRHRARIIAVGADGFDFRQDDAGTPAQARTLPFARLVAVASLVQGTTLSQW